MSQALKELETIYPDKIILKISAHPKLYTKLNYEANTNNMTLQEYITNAGFTYGPDATILNLESIIKRTLQESGVNKVTYDLLQELKLYTYTYRVCRVYGLSVSEYISSLGFEYERRPKYDAHVDFKMINILKHDFNLHLKQIGEIVGASKQRIEKITKSGISNVIDWYTTDLSSVSDDFETMIKNHLFEMELGEVQYFIFNNSKKEVCFLWKDEEHIHYVLTEDLGADFLDLLKSEKMDIFNSEDFHMLSTIQTVYILKKPYAMLSNVPLFRNILKRRNLSTEEYANFLGFVNTVSVKNTITDEKIIEFFESSMVNGEVYISSDPSNQWIKSFASRSHMSLDEFVSFYGYKKANRSKYAELPDHIDQAREELRQELAMIEENGYVTPDHPLYCRLYSFASKQNLTINELIEDLGFKRKYANMGRPKNSST